MRLRSPSKRRRYIYKSGLKRLGAGFFDVMGKAAFAGRRRPWDLTDVRRILVVRMDQLGDTLFAAPAVEYLHELLPEASIDFLAGPWAAPLVKHFPHVSRTLVFEDNWYSPERRYRRCAQKAKAVLKTLRENRYDLGIDLRGDVRNIALMRAAGISRILGYGVTGGKFLLDRSAPYDFFAHQVDLNLRLVAEVAGGIAGNGRQVPTKEQRKPRLLRPALVGEATRDFGWTNAASPKILMHAEAGYPSKRWDRRRFVQLIAALEKKGAHIGLIGTEKDDLTAAPELAPCAEHIKDFRGKTNLLELSCLIAQSDLLIGNDSAPSHIAAALGTPCVVLFSGANDPSRWHPVGDHVHLLYHPVKCSPCESRHCLMPTHECMDAISVHEVENVVHDILTAQAL